MIESAVTSFGPSPGYRNPTSDRPRGWRTYAEFGGGPMRDWGAHLRSGGADRRAGAPERLRGRAVPAGLGRGDGGDGLAALPSPAGGGPEGLRYGIETGSISALPKPRWFVRGSEGAYLQYGRDPQEALHRGKWGPG